MALADIIKKIFGSKADRDYKAVKPTLQKILAVYPEIDALSNDDLRSRSAALRERPAESAAEDAGAARNDGNFSLKIRPYRQLHHFSSSYAL